MSEDGFSDCFEEPNMEIQIKTLLGTTFDIKVSFNDTVGDIKKKIYRVEGIPIYQQNLIFQSTELKDTIRLCDSGIRNGSTLTLVSSMRGGPISTRRLSVACDHFLLKELKDLLENSRDEVNSGSKVSVLVFKEGDIINLLRVIENEDGSYSPYGESTISPPTLQKEALETFQRLVEDKKMCTKLETIRRNLEELSERRQNRIRKDSIRTDEAKSSGDVSDIKGISDSAGLTIYERSDEGNQSESEEIALKDKHRTKPKDLQNFLVAKSGKSLYSERKGTYSHTRQSYARISKRRESGRLSSDKADINSNQYSTYSRERNIYKEREKHDLGGIYLNEDGMVLPGSDVLKGDSLEQSYLLEGLASDKLPDLSTSEQHNFLMNNFDSHQDKDITTTACRGLGPFIPDLSHADSTKTTSLDSKVSGSGYSLPNSSRLFHSHSLESKIFPSLNTFSNKKNQSSLPNVNDSLETLPNLTRLETLGNISGSRGESPVLEINETSVEEMSTKLADQLHFLDDESNGDMYGESISVSARNRVHLTRLVLSSDGAERPKSSPNSIELEERGQDLWEIHEPASERLKHSATCKVGLMKRHQGLEYNYDSLENAQSNLKPDIGKFSKSSTEYGVCSGTNYYMPQYLSTPSAIPPQYAPKQQSNYCDLYFRSERRSPLYSRRNRKENIEDKETVSKEKSCSSVATDFLSDCSRIQRLKNDDSFCKSKDELLHDFYGYCNLYSSSSVCIQKEEKHEVVKLPPVIKKKSRCSECNKKLNITNIYNCRCGRIFCSQHRYSEVHRCTYDYKTEGRKILERQNPLVTAEKIKRL
ncbi:hypothetical protein GWI33_020886 [Rhynchophorus ferrugineus]|uniref:Uncharacterized protein n=1 Tax=Rhynchophorus ferrugineus TaxID=354439 RepID=A0A834M5G9_RHYFE|nr:hypothetical protein GWI33_020886 [Rhynchophorus ferrugineus]